MHRRPLERTSRDALPVKPGGQPQRAKYRAVAALLAWGKIIHVDLEALGTFLHRLTILHVVTVMRGSAQTTELLDPSAKVKHWPRLTVIHTYMHTYIHTVGQLLWVHR